MSEKNLVLMKEKYIKILDEFDYFLNKNLNF